MSEYMLLVYQEEVEPSEQAEREKEMPIFVELHRSLREAGLLVGVQRLHSTESATVRVRRRDRDHRRPVRGDQGGPGRGYYILDCADLDEALKQAARVPAARWGTVEVRPVMAADQWLRVSREAGADLPDEAVEDMA